MEEKPILMPCPFCGNTNTQPGRFGGLQVAGMEGSGWYVLCAGTKGCGATGPYHSDKSRQWAIDQWNKRG
jgi:hypothetical protein